MSESNLLLRFRTSEFVDTVLSIRDGFSGLEELEIILNCQLFGSILVWIPGLKVTETSEQGEG